MATVNPWRRFIGLLPGGARTVGEVIDVDEGAGTCRVRLRNNVVIAARGTAVSAGQMAFISDGLVTGPAPQLPQFDIEV
ncbi:hypothetical protein [Pseudomonas aeruginosa]|uniref:hypothetical protein n=2 Tax=Pseudomonas TaxID=286 RepID=UPI0003BAD4F0|nr:hypothetical protein [Pseudomonas aeruginosa]EIU7171574.1 hypothetical protein [Pseudomonas aeruginosa]EKQ6322029.1 hypothetical protein [Pseudomonas aeruginosa]EKQ7202404.1 hypothetical protein [Pseudomonas aeruginosa]ELK4842930.1 hypothetical protein [Pseudomonas aeruginosa]ELO0919895.1 hypothetical protein [Pseudomonas aeruginosa]